MKTFTNIIKFTFLCFCIICLGKGFIYRKLIGYRSIGQREQIAITNDNLISFLEKHDFSNYTSIEDIIQFSQNQTAKILSFSYTDSRTNPNVTFESGKTNCIGYANMFVVICNYILQKNKLGDWEAKTQIGQLYCTNHNIHPYFHSNFFKDHDFVIISNKKSRQKIAIDPSLYDYFWINHVTLNE